MITIYGKDGAPLCEVSIANDAVHEEELMTSNFVRLTWRDTSRYVLPVGSYIVPFVDGVKYRLLEAYEPNGEGERKFRYEPQFQHPVMWLSYIPYRPESL